MRVDEFDFELPEDRIALTPARPRDSARLLFAPEAGQFQDLLVRDVTAVLRPGDLFVFNDTRVIRARLAGLRHRGEATFAMEATLLRRLDAARWTAFLKPGRRLRVGDRLHFSAVEDRADLVGPVEAMVVAKNDTGEATLEFELRGAALDQAIAAIGRMPLPPYIANKRAPNNADESDYQTMFAERDGAIAAPTAGLHFTTDLMAALAQRGVETARITLHVGAGTFLPVKTEDTSEHRMHAEWRSITEETALKINAARAEGRRVIAVGTTVLRSLESSADEAGQVCAMAGETSLFIVPGYRFRVVDALLTNFHLPRSTLFMLACAFAGTERMKDVYRHAIESGYRFYSYGDASLLERGK